MSLCYICRQEEAMPGQPCCEDIECIRKYNTGRRWTTCTKCGEEFLCYASNLKNKRICWKCDYQERYESYRKKKKTDKKTSTNKASIDDILGEQERIREATGRHISYGKLMARKG